MSDVGSPSAASPPTLRAQKGSCQSAGPRATHLGVCLLLPHEAVCGHPEFGYAGVPHIFDQGADLICFWDVVRSTKGSKDEINCIRKHSLN